MKIIVMLLFLTIFFNCSGNNTDGEFLALVEDASLEKIVQAIENGADVNEKDENKYSQKSALMKAAKSNSAEVVKYLIEAGAIIEDGDYYNRTALHYAAQYNPNPKVIRILIDARSKFETRGGPFQTTPLSKAVQYNKLEIVKELILAGANPYLLNRNGKPLILVAAWNEDVRVVEYLLEQLDIDINRIYKDGKTLLLKAAEWNNNPHVFKYLIENGADASVKDKNGSTPLMLAANNSKKGGNAEVIQVILNYNKEDIETRDIYGNTALIYACGLGMSSRGEEFPVENAEILLKHGADIGVKNKFGITPMQKAIEYHNGETNSKLVKLLSKENSID